MKEYTKKQVDEMREALASRSIDYWDEETIYDIAMDGCIGYKNMPDHECIEQYEDVWGELPENPHVTLEIEEDGAVKKIL